MENLSSVDIAELPQQLVLRTTNPIQLAFKYALAEPEPAPTLTVTRHQEVDVQTTVIDSAHYRTVYTRDGFTVTTANFIVRNSPQQFLRVRLPQGSAVWSAAVQGQPETQALPSNGDEAPEVLVNIINSSEGFPVEGYTRPRRRIWGSWTASPASFRYLTWSSRKAAGISTCRTTSGTALRSRTWMS